MIVTINKTGSHFTALIQIVQHLLVDDRVFGTGAIISKLNLAFLRFFEAKDHHNNMRKSIKSPTKVHRDDQ